MPHVLHLVREPGLPAARETIVRQARDPATRVSVVLLPGDAPPAEPPASPAGWPPGTRRLQDGTGSADTRHPAITYRELLALIFEADTVVTW
jgi:hypothetical protein